MKLPDHLHKGLLYSIILGGAIDFNDYDKDGQQDEEEDSNNDAYVVSSYEEK